MNDPWSTLVTVLSGTPSRTPKQWKAVKVHRILDDPPGKPMPAPPPRGQRQVSRLAPGEAGGPRVQ